MNPRRKLTLKRVMKGDQAAQRSLYQFIESLKKHEPFSGTISEQVDLFEHSTTIYFSSASERNKFFDACYAFCSREKQGNPNTSNVPFYSDAEKTYFSFAQIMIDKR